MKVLQVIMSEKIKNTLRRMAISVYFRPFHNLFREVSLLYLGPKNDVTFWII